MERLAGGDPGLLHAGGHGDRLEGGADGVGGQHGPVQERLAGVVGQRVVRFGAQAVGQPLGIEAGVGGQRQHAVVPRVHHYDRADALAERLLSHLLGSDVQGEDDVLPGFGRHLRDRAADGAFGRDRGEGAAALARQDIVHLTLHAEDADLVAGAVAPRRQLLQLLGVDLGHMAHDVGGRVAVRVDALRLLPHHDTQFVEGVELLQRLLLCAVGQRLDGDEVVRGQIRLYLGAHVAFGHAERGGEAGDERFLVGDEVRHEADDREVGVHRQRLAVAVEDGAATGDLREEVDEGAVVQFDEDEAGRPGDAPLLAHLRRVPRRGEHRRLLLHQGDPLRLPDVAEEGRVDRDFHRDVGVVVPHVGADFEVDAGDRRLLGDRLVALDELLFVDLRPRLGGDEVVHVAVLLLLPELEEALGGLQGILRWLALLRLGRGRRLRLQHRAGGDDHEECGKEGGEPAHDG